MDRREALKKLAAGGAIAAGGSIVLSSNQVAFAASAGGVTGIPGPGEPLPITSGETSDGEGYQIADVTSPGCTDGATVTTSHSWKINSYALGAGFLPVVVVYGGLNSSSNQFVVGGPGLVCGPGCTGYSAPTSFAAVTIRKRNVFGLFDSSLDNGDSYEIDTLITWSCPGHPPVVAEYRFSGTFPNAPTVTILQNPT